MLVCLFLRTRTKFSHLFPFSGSYGAFPLPIVDGFLATGFLGLLIVAAQEGNLKGSQDCGQVPCRAEVD